MQGYRAKNLQDLLDGPPGGYLIVTDHDTNKRTLWIKDPAGYIGCCGKHEVVEHDDGTVTVSPSILSTKSEHGHEWHGYLEHGVWREV